MSPKNSTFEDKISIYIDTLLRWNEVHNLSGRLTHKRGMEYVRQSVYPLDFIDDFRICVDIGSGAGFPAIPLAIANQSAKFILIEINKKKCAFLRLIAATLGLRNVEILNADFKMVNLAHKTCDLITSRALMKADVLIKNATHLLSDDGHFLLYKGSNAIDELGEFNARILRDESLMNYCYIPNAKIPKNSKEKKSKDE